MKLPALYAILDTGALARRSLPVADTAAAMLEGGARALQFRHKGHFSRAIFQEAERVAELCRRFGALWIVNDRADIAKLLGAGVHLGQDDLPPVNARELLGPDAVIGLSTHNAAQLEAAAAEPVDYVALGPVFTTGSKENAERPLGVEKVRAWRGLTARPLVAIGGITRANAASILAAGADTVAVISDLLPEASTIGSVRRRMEEWLRLLNQ